MVVMLLPFNSCFLIIKTYKSEDPRCYGVFYFGRILMLLEFLSELSICRVDCPHIRHLTSVKDDGYRR